MTGVRSAPLPAAAPRGRLVVPASVAAETQAALLASRGPDGPHEGLVLWAGLEDGSATVALVAIRPAADTGWGHVLVPEAAALAAVRAAHALGLGVVAQVHSHPGRDARHSDGDDRLIFMPFEGMFSLVCAEYGRHGLGTPGATGVHQMQDGRWVSVEPAKSLLIVPGAVEIR